MNFPSNKSKTDPSPLTMMVGWTTAGSRSEAEMLGRSLVEAGLVACAQVDGPITSIYRWKGAIESAEEYRLTLKFSGARAADVEAWILRHHNYETPQWVAVAADAVTKNYLNWVVQTSS